MKERIRKLITKWHERAEWARTKMDVAIRTIDKVAYEAVWLESTRISDDLESLLALLPSESELPVSSKEQQTQPKWQPSATAPKEGTDVMTIYTCDADGVHYRPTHWMKLSDPPKEQWTHPTWEPALPPPTPPPVKGES